MGHRSSTGARRTVATLPVLGPQGLDGRVHDVRKEAMVAMAYDDEHVARFAEIVNAGLETMRTDREVRNATHPSGEDPKG